MPFDFFKTGIDGVWLIKPKVFEDKRGFFLETFKLSEFKKNNIDTDFVQDNHSMSVKGVLRGLHYQKEPFAQGKLVRCIRGRVFDVAVDIRIGSPTFGRWVGYELSEKNKNILWIPKGFAHGFLTLSDEAEIIYKVSGAEYSPEHEAGIIWNDKTINIKWPLNNIEVLLSEKDKILPSIENAEINFRNL